MNVRLFLLALCFGAISVHMGRIYKLLSTPTRVRNLLTK